ncbi:MAG: transporter substrate-binding domain-containing protein [Lactobacillaceae bacterium]|jgi:putative glutamine transport system substrate-binding protein|nr:transporter substrate-binding domain-containing protein [Lapidilactobacillus gannanensis]MCH4057009.1 transporter substrate-binding domain-containing protein [Lactobacillaceae bacterium]
MVTLLTVLSGCGDNLAQQDVMARVKRTNHITWGVKNDTRLFGLMNIKTGEIEGFDVDIATAISQEIFGKDVDVKFVPVTSNTRLPLLKNGNIDALAATMTITPERKKEIMFSDTYFNAGQAIMVKKGSKIKSVKDLTSGTKVLGLQGSNSVANIKKYAPDAKVLQLADTAQAFTALKSGQGDAMTSDNGILYGLNRDDPNYQVVGGTFTNEPYGIGMNKGQEKFAKAVNQALKKIEADGTYQKIVDKWFSKVAGFDGSVIK